jgi:hypothetical protein
MVEPEPAAVLRSRGALFGQGSGSPDGITESVLGFKPDFPELAYSLLIFCLHSEQIGMTAF